MNNFLISCCRLLQQYPLVKYRKVISEDKYELKVLLIGSGTRLDTLLQEILMNGQLLDTALYVTVVTSNPGRAAKALLEKAPELKKYAQICCENNSLSSPDESCIYAHINYYALPKAREKFIEVVNEWAGEGYNYVIISTGNDEKNKFYAEAVAEVGRKAELIAFVQNKKPSGDPGDKVHSTVFAFGYQKDSDTLDTLEVIAYNLHYAYSKSMNDRASNEEIRLKFQEPYCYISNLEAAMHIREKLECCAIDTSDNMKAAYEFSRLLLDNSEMVNRLAALEHRRWMMEKIMKGFELVKTLDKIYSGPDITTHDSAGKWHVCLVPCDEVSHLTLSHWKAPSRDYSSELDFLDQMSLKIHVKCGQIAHGNREQIEESLRIIHNSFQRIFNGREDIFSHLHSMELAISQMWQNKRSAISIYEGNFSALMKVVSALNSSSSYYLQQTLSALNDAIAPLKEYISFKDYKEQDRLLIQQIPFALTHKKKPGLVKLLSTKEVDSLFSTCHLEPDSVTFVWLITTYDEYLWSKEEIQNITRFLTQSYPFITAKYHIILCESIVREHYDKLGGLMPDNIIIHKICDVNYQAVSEVLNSIVSAVQADYIDVTNSDSLLMLCAAGTNIPIIAHKAGKMVNILNAPEVTYTSPKKVITVKEMFDLSGSVLIEESDSSLLSDLSGCYKKFFNIAKTTSNWDGFCKYIAEFYKNENKFYMELPVLDHTEKVVNKSVTINSDIASALIPVFTKLEKENYISAVSLSSNLTGQKTISYKISGERAGNIMNTKIHECIMHYVPTTTYKVVAKENRSEIICSNLLIKNMILPQDRKKEYVQTLNGLASNKLVIDYVVDQSDHSQTKVSFQFASKDVLDVIQNSGKVLEYYIYYSALLDAHFDDVEMGWHFQHTASKESADNELDIICTKGMSSLFISAKNVTKKDAQYLKYVIYEISLLADRFGINAKPVLAMPAIEQFQQNPQTQEWEFSKEVKTAYKRGVYLLGKECFNKDVLGEVLDRISDGRDDWCDFLKK